jgi:hypothetical protein
MTSSCQVAQVSRRVRVHVKLPDVGDTLSKVLSKTRQVYSWLMVAFGDAQFQLSVVVMTFKDMKILDH